MKLPSLSHPTRRVYRTVDEDGVVDTIIESYSDFDCLPAWAQWGLMGLLAFSCTGLLIAEFFHGRT